MRRPDIETLAAREQVRLIRPCSLCAGTGYVGTEDEPKRCSCGREVDRLVSLAWGNIPREFWDVERRTFDGDSARLVEQARRWHLRNARLEGRSMVMVGSYGVGKTTSACLVLSRAARRRYSVGYITVADLVRSEMEHRDDEEFVEWREGLLDSDFLVLDELGKEHRKDGSDYVLSLVEALLRRRRGDYRSTIVITNLPWTEFEERCGDAVMSLLADRAEVLHFRGQDRRRQARRDR